MCPTESGKKKSTMTFRMDRLLVPLKPLGIFSLPAPLLGNKHASSLQAA